MNPVLLQQPKRLFFGSGCAARCGAELESAGARRVFVVTSPRAGKAAAVHIADWRQRGAAVEVCDGVSQEPDLDIFRAATAAARSFAPDWVVGIGGGSPLDVAKLVAAFGDGVQDIAASWGVDLLRVRAWKLACMPTTAGTGSEVSPNAVLIDRAAKTKRAVISPHLVPDVAFCDPDLTLGLSPTSTAATALDALTHCIEAYANRAAHPAVDLYAREGVRLIGAAVERAVHDGSDRAARSDVMLGALYGGLCLGPVNTAAVHALSYPLGGEYGVPHGVANSLLLPHVLRFNLPAMPGRYAEIARLLGVPGDGSLAHAERGLARIEEMSRRCGIPSRLSEVGIAESAIPSMAAEAMKVTRLLKNNPRELTLADAEAIYRHAC